MSSTEITLHVLDIAMHMAAIVAHVAWWVAYFRGGQADGQG